MERQPERAVWLKGGAGGAEETASRGHGQACCRALLEVWDKGGLGFDRRFL